MEFSIYSWSGVKLKLLGFFLSPPLLFWMLLFNLLISSSSSSSSWSSYMESRRLFEFVSSLSAKNATFLNYDCSCPFCLVDNYEPFTDLLALAVSKTFLEYLEWNEMRSMTLSYSILPLAVFYNFVPSVMSSLLVLPFEFKLWISSSSSLDRWFELMSSSLSSASFLARPFLWGGESSHLFFWKDSLLLFGAISPSFSCVFSRVDTSLPLLKSSLESENPPFASLPSNLLLKKEPLLAVFYFGEVCGELRLTCYWIKVWSKPFFDPSVPLVFGSTFIDFLD